MAGAIQDAAELVRQADRLNSYAAAGWQIDGSVYNSGRKAILERVMVREDGYWSEAFFQFERDGVRFNFSRMLQPNDVLRMAYRL